MNLPSPNVGKSLSTPPAILSKKGTPFAITGKKKRFFGAGRSQAIFLCQLCAVFLDGRRIVDSNKSGGSVGQTGSFHEVVILHVNE